MLGAGILTFHCDPDLECSNPIFFPHKTLICLKEKNHRHWIQTRSHDYSRGRRMAVNAVYTMGEGWGGGGGGVSDVTCGFATSEGFLITA